MAARLHSSLLRFVRELSLGVTKERTLEWWPLGPCHGPGNGGRKEDRRLGTAPSPSPPDSTYTCKSRDWWVSMTHTHVKAGTGECRRQTHVKAGTGECRWQTDVKAGTGECRWQTHVKAGTGECRWQTHVKSGTGEYRWQTCGSRGWWVSMTHAGKSKDWWVSVTDTCKSRDWWVSMTGTCKSKDWWVSQDRNEWLGISILSGGPMTGATIKDKYIH